MNILAWWSMPASRIIGRISSWLHFLPLLAGFCVVIYLLWTSVTRERKTNFPSKIKFSPITTRAYQFWKRLKKNGTGAADYGPIWFVAIVGLGLVVGASRINNAPIVEKYNVSVLEQVAPNKWAMRDEQGPFLYTGCDDFPNSTVIWPGYVARKMRWQEFGSCKSIRRQDLGVWWDRDERFNVRRIP